MATFLALRRWPPIISNSIQDGSKPINNYKLQSRCHIVLSSPEKPSRRQQILGCCGVSLVAIFSFNCSLPLLPAWAGNESNGQEGKDEGVIGAIKSLLDPDEKTKSGKLLPKAYLNSAREVVKTLRESLKEDPKDIARFKRGAEAAKNSIREYLSVWKGQQKVVSEESYVELEKAIRSLASFYSKAGPSAPLPEEIKFKILNSLDLAEEFM